MELFCGACNKRTPHCGGEPVHCLNCDINECFIAGDEITAEEFWQMENGYCNFAHECGEKAEPELDYCLKHWSEIQRVTEKGYMDDDDLEAMRNWQKNQKRVKQKLHAEYMAAKLK